MIHSKFILIFKSLWGRMIIVIFLKCSRKGLKSMYNVIDYLEQSCQKYSKKIAIREPNQKITYEEFQEASKRVGSYLGSIYFNEPIIIYMEKGIDTLIAFFGTIYAGCFYTLINPELPGIRISQIKNKIHARVVITTKEDLETAEKYFEGLEVLTIEELKKEPIQEEVLVSSYQRHIDTDPLYVNFTSGSTGVPKGVTISHRSVIDFIDVFTRLFHFFFFVSF